MNTKIRNIKLNTKVFVNLAMCCLSATTISPAYSQSSNDAPNGWTTLNLPLNKNSDIRVDVPAKIGITKIKTNIGTFREYTGDCGINNPPFFFGIKILESYESKKFDSKSWIPDLVINGIRESWKNSDKFEYLSSKILDLQLQGVQEKTIQGEVKDKVSDLLFTTIYSTIKADECRVDIMITYDSRFAKNVQYSDILLKSIKIISEKSLSIQPQEKSK